MSALGASTHIRGSNIVQSLAASQQTKHAASTFQLTLTHSSDSKFNGSIM